MLSRLIQCFKTTS